MNCSNRFTTQSSERLHVTKSQSSTALCLGLRICNAIWFASWTSCNIVGLSSERINWADVRAFRVDTFPSAPVLCLVTSARSTGSNDVCTAVTRFRSFFDEDSMCETKTSLTSDFNSSIISMVIQGADMSGRQISKFVHLVRRIDTPIDVKNLMIIKRNDRCGAPMKKISSNPFQISAILPQICHCT